MTDKELEKPLVGLPPEFLLAQAASGDGRKLESYETWRVLSFVGGKFDRFVPSREGEDWKTRRNAEACAKRETEFAAACAKRSPTSGWADTVYVVRPVRVTVEDIGEEKEKQDEN